MKRERTKDFDVLRLVDTISIVERKSGAVVASFAIPCEETRTALVRLLSDPVKSGAADEATPETAPEKAETTGDEKQAAKPKSTKKSSKKASS